MGAIGAPVAAAELEGGDEPGMVTVDTPTGPTNDVEALLHQVRISILLLATHNNKATQLIHLQPIEIYCCLGAFTIFF